MSNVELSEAVLAVYRNKAQEEPVAFYVLDSLDGAVQVVLASETGGYYDIGLRYEAVPINVLRDEVERLNQEVFGLTADEALSLVGRSMFGGAK